MRRIAIAQGLAILFLATAAPAFASPTFTPLFTFSSPNGRQPEATLIQGVDGLLYGTAALGGANADGDLFNIDTGADTFNDILDFDNASTPVGAVPAGSLVQGTDGNLYGTTSSGGAHISGTVFKVGTDGSNFTDLYEFGGVAGDPVMPLAGLVEGSDGNFYGTSALGGANNSGTVFEISSAGGSITVLHSFGATADLSDARSTLIEGVDGSLYGTAAFGGAGGHGGVFRINLDGTGYAILHSFTGAEGSASFCGLTSGGDGFLYGVTKSGGTNSSGTVFKIATDGGGYQTMHSFTASATDAGDPFGALALGNDGNLYGAGMVGGVNGDGALFEIARNGSTDTLLYSIDTSTDGDNPEGGLLQATNGLFFGTMSEGPGGNGQPGTIFSLDNGLQPSPNGLYALGSDAQVQLFWNTDVDQSVDPNAGYDLYRSTTSGGEGNVPYQTELFNPNFIDNNVTNGTQYFYKVTGITPNGTETPQSYEVTATPQASIGGLSASPNPATGGEPVTLTFSVAQAAPGPTTAFLSSNGDPNVTFSSPDVTVPANQPSADITITPANIGIGYEAVITVSEIGEDLSRVLEVNAPPVLHTYQSGLQMISAPSDDTGISLANDFGQQGSPAPELAVWTGSTYAVSPTTPANTIVTGQGYWFHPASTTDLYDIGTDTNPGLPVSFSLVTGWNMIGDPFNAATAASGLQVTSGLNTLSFANANLAGLVGDTFYTWQPGDSAYEAQAAASATLQPFEGYWLYAFQPCTLVVPIPGGH